MAARGLEHRRGLAAPGVTAQSEYSTDILFRKRADLEELMPRLCQYSAIYFSASDVMSFLGRKLTGHFQGEVVTDQREVEVPGTRVPGLRVKHRMKFNCIKMYDKRPVLRIETVINNQGRIPGAPARTSPRP